MPIFYDRIADQVEELLPEFYREDGPRFVSFLKSYFEYLEKGQLIYKDAADIDYIGLEDGTVAGEAFNTDGQRGNMLQEVGTYAPSSITTARLNYEHDIDSGGAQKTSFEKDEYVVGNVSGAIGRIDVIGSSSNLYIEQFSEAQFEIDEAITGKTSGMEAKVASFKASPLQAANNLLSYADVDKTSGDFIEYFRRDFMPFIDRDIIANKRLLHKHIKELYLSKGTKESYEFLFRILYGLEAEVVFPGDNVIKPSESEFSEPTVMRLYSTSDLKPYKRGLIKKLDALGNIESQAYINDAYGMSGTNDGNDAYELELILPYVGTFSQGDSVILSDRDGFRIDADATVRGVMTDIDPDESSIYVGLEESIAGADDDIIRIENPTPIYILNEDGNNVLMEDESELIFEHAENGAVYQAMPFQLETATGSGILITEESVYDVDDNLITDYALLNENTDLYYGMVTHGTIDPQWAGTPSTRAMGGGLYDEKASSGALYSESDTFNYLSPAGGVASQTINVIGATGSGGITEIIIDDVGSGYDSGDELVFINDGTSGDNAEGRVSVTDGLIELENATMPGVYEFTATSGQTVFTGLDNNNLLLGFDPRKVQVFVAGTEKTRETQFTTDKSGLKVTLTSGASTGQAVEIHRTNRSVLLEESLRPNGKAHFIEDELSGAIRNINITNNGTNYKSLPKVFMGGYIYYDTMTSGTDFSTGEILTDSDNSRTMVVVKHDTEKKRILVYKRPEDPPGAPAGTVTGGTSSSQTVVLSTNVTAGSGAKLWAWGDNIGSVKKLKMQDIGHSFVQGGIGNYKQHAVIKDRSNSGSDTPVVNTIVTANLTGASGTVNTFDGDRNILSMTKVKGIFNDGDYCTTSDNKNFIIGKINPCTARGKLGGTALLDGNYTNDTGFPSVDAMRIHDSSQYQDFSYKIKVGKGINDYRSIIKSLLSPAGTIFFGEVSIRNTVDAKATIYNVNFDGTQTTRSFVPTLIIGSKIDAADIQLEDGTFTGTDQVFSSYEGRLQLETEEGIIVTERFLCTDIIATNHNTHTVKDQASGQPYVVGTDTVAETDKNLYERQLTAEATPKGSRVTKEIEIYPAYNQHKISYGTLSNALAVGTLVRGASSNALGYVMEHDTTNKFIIVHRDQLDWGQKGSQFSGTEIIQNITSEGLSTTNYFTATDIELHWIPEDIVTKQEPSSITADSYITSQAQKTATEGGADTTETWTSSGINPGSTAGYHGRGRVLTSATEDRSEFYDSDMRQRKVNVISSPIFTHRYNIITEDNNRIALSGTGQEGYYIGHEDGTLDEFYAGVKQARTLNTQSSRTLGSNTIVANSNGTALRIDDRFNQITLVGNSFGHRPAGQRLFESTNFLSEQIVSESQEPIIYEPYNGRILGEEFTEGGVILLEDSGQVLWEDATVNDETIYIVSEQSSQIGSFNLIDESGNRLIDETNSKPLLQEQSLMNGEKESNQSGPSIGDLRDMMFTENYKLMAKIQLDGGSGISSGDDLLLETGDHMLQESPTEGLRISDISTIYPQGFVSNFENVLGRKTNLNHSAVVQTG